MTNGRYANGRYDLSRLLADQNSTDARRYEVRTVVDDVPLFEFVTGGVNGKTADETAIGNLFDASEYYEQELAVYRTAPRGAERLATAQGGIGQDHRAVTPEFGGSPYNGDDGSDGRDSVEWPVYPADDADRRGFGK